MLIPISTKKSLTYLFLPGYQFEKLAALSVLNDHEDIRWGVYEFVMFDYMGMVKQSEHPDFSLNLLEDAHLSYASLIHYFYRHSVTSELMLSNYHKELDRGMYA